MFLVLNTLVSQKVNVAELTGQLINVVELTEIMMLLSWIRTTWNGFYCI